jgi:hypothetical protein
MNIGISKHVICAVVLAFPGLVEAADKPNIVVFLTDDQDEPVTKVGCMHGENAAKSDRLAVK